MKRVAILLFLLLVGLPAGAQITYFGQGALGSATTTNDPQAALPASTATDDIIIVHCYIRDTTNTTVVTDYTEFAQLDTANVDHRWFWKRHDGSEGTAVCNRDVSADGYARAYVFRGVITTGNPWNALGTPEQHTSEPMSVTGITTGAANSMVVLIDGYADNNTASAITTATDPATFTDIYNETTTGEDGSMHIAYAIRTAAGATGTITLNYSAAFTGGDQDGVVVLSLAPVPPPADDTITQTILVH